MRDFVHAGSPSPPPIKTGVSISSGGAHGIAFLGRMRALNNSGHLNNLSALSGASAGAVIASFIGSTVNRGLLQDGHRDNIQEHINTGIDHAYDVFSKAADNGSNIDAATLGVLKNPFLAPYFESVVKAMPDCINDWHMQNFPPYLDPEAVEQGPIDVFIGVTHVSDKMYYSNIKINDVRPEVIAASCALKDSILVDGKALLDGGFTKAAPTSSLIKDAGCNEIIMIGETTGAPQMARHQTQAMIAERTTHASGYFEGHAGRLRREYPDMPIHYSGIPLPDCDKSRGNVTRTNFKRLYTLGYESFLPSEHPKGDRTAALG